MIRALVLAASICLAAPHVSACTASFYGSESGTRTANGEHFSPGAMTAAMPSRRYLNHWVRVGWNGRSVDLYVNDYGPASWTGRCIDVTRGAARRLGFERAGTANVTIEMVR